MTSRVDATATLGDGQSASGAGGRDLALWEPK